MAKSFLSKLFSRKNKKNNDTDKKEIEDFKSTLVNFPKVKDLYGDNFDAFLDKARENGLCDEIPLFGGVIRITRKSLDTYGAFNTYRFCKKAYSFLINAKDITIEEIDKFFQEYSDFTNENGYELMLSVIDRIDNTNKASILGKLFSAKLKGYITIEDYVRMCSILQQIPFVDLRYLPSYINERVEGRDTYSLISSGLIIQTTIDAEGPSKYQLNDNGIIMTKYGLEVDVNEFKREKTKVKGVAEPISPEEIEKMWNETK